MLPLLELELESRCTIRDPLTGAAHASPAADLIVGNSNNELALTEAHPRLRHFIADPH